MTDDAESSAGRSPGSETDAPAPRSRRGWIWLPFGLFITLAAVFLVQLWKGDASRLPSALIGREVPRFSLPGLEGLVREGQPVPGLSSADLAGRGVTIVNIWASWCVPCRDEHPLLVELARRDDIRLVGINYKDQPDNARRFLGALGNPFQAVGVDPTGRASIEWGVYGVPETFVVNGAGRIIHKHVGPLTPQSLTGPFGAAIQQAKGGP
jgi:cytochrome c biogenesis protein CcmG/thiol:disulfide interchange protein DsbE